MENPKSAETKQNPKSEEQRIIEETKAIGKQAEGNQGAMIDFEEEESENEEQVPNQSPETPLKETEDKEDEFQILSQGGTPSDKKENDSNSKSSAQNPNQNAEAEQNDQEILAEKEMPGPRKTLKNEKMKVGESLRPKSENKRKRLASKDSGVQRTSEPRENMGSRTRMLNEETEKIKSPKPQETRNDRNLALKPKRSIPRKRNRSKDKISERRSSIQMENQRKDSDQHFLRLSKKNLEFEDQIRKFKERVERLRNEIEEKNNEIENHIEEKSIFKNEIEDVRKNNEKLKTENSDFRKMIVENVTQFNNLKIEGIFF